MRRWFAVLLLFLLPLQFSWAAVATYCGHESDAHAQHFGHHEHQHASSAGVHPDADGAGIEAPPGLDSDCGHSHCHGGGIGMPAPVGGVNPVATVLRPVARVEGSVRTLAQHPPERPQWAPLA